MAKKCRELSGFAWIVLVVLMTAHGSTRAEIPPEREGMLEAIRDSVRNSADYTGRTELSDRVMDAMANRTSNGVLASSAQAARTGSAAA